MIDLNRVNDTSELESGDRDVFDIFSEKGTIKNIINNTSSTNNKNAQMLAKAKVMADAVKPTVDKIKGKAGEISSGIKGADRGFQSWQPDSRSIVARARSSVLMFPMYISDTISVPAAQVLSKSFERVYASFVQTVMSQRPIIQDANDVNDMKFLRQYHTNIKDTETGTNLKELLIGGLLNEHYEPIDQFDAIMVESIYNETSIENGNVSFAYFPYPINQLCRESMRLSTEPLTGFTYLLEADTDDNNNDDDAKSNDTGMGNQVKTTIGSRTVERVLTDGEIVKIAKELGWNEGLRGDIAIIAKTAQKLENDGPVKLKDGSTIYLKSNANGDPEILLSIDKRTKERVVSSPVTLPAPVMLNPNDIRKINNMLPYQMVVTFRVMPKGANTAYDVNFVIGVKTNLHLINANDLIKDIKEIIVGKQNRLQKIRYKTGEISFWRDYVTNIKGIKADAAKNITGKRWLANLKRLGSYKELDNTIFKGGIEVLTGGNVPIPNGTMILRNEDVGIIKNTTGINLEDIRHARALCKNLFLISFVIVDEIAGTIAIFFPDMDEDFDMQSIATLQADVERSADAPLIKELQKIIRR